MRFDRIACAVAGASPRRHGEAQKPAAAAANASRRTRTDWQTRLDERTRYFSPLTLRCGAAGFEQRAAHVDSDRRVGLGVDGFLEMLYRAHVGIAERRGCCTDVIGRGAVPLQALVFALPGSALRFSSAIVFE